MNPKFWFPMALGLAFFACEKSETIPAPSSAAQAAPAAAAPSSSAANSGEMTLEDALKSGQIQNDSTLDSGSAPEFAALPADKPAEAAKAPQEAPAPQAEAVPVSPAPSTPAAKPIPVTPKAPAASNAPKAITKTAAKASPTQPSGGAYVLQVKASSDRSEITRDQKRLQNSGIKSYITTLDQGGTTLYRLRIGSFSSPAEAKSFGNAKLTSMGLSFWVDQKSHEN